MNQDTHHRNRLSGETSPYLLQHAGNPVDWYPWGDEAFARAAAEDRPVFLSIGYSTCHWCHVMERESFEDREIADLMNRAFVSIKVDREERPDIDRLYMEFCQALTGSGGWPLTIIMTPGKKPFFAATYIPPDTRHGRTGMRELIPAIEKIWREERERVEDSAARITGALGGAGEAKINGVGPDLLESFEALARGFDPRYGGFGDAPKFPMPHVLIFLARFWRATGDGRARDMAVKTLDSLRRGGIRDHLGQGFHRYSTDAAWRLPHFEKMLYDQALLALAFLEAGQAFGIDGYAETARSIFEYVLRDLTDPGGGFYSAEDADSEGEEGRYYLWRREEIVDALGPDRAEGFCRAFGVKPEGNFLHESTGRMTGDNVLIMGGDDSDRRLRDAEPELLRARRTRERPLRDDKILADWNGLMIAALARGARVLGDDRYAGAARRAADHLLAEMRGDGGALLHCLRGGLPAVRAMADDYAFVVWGLLELYEATFESCYLREALVLNDRFITDFWDDDAGAFYSTGLDGGEDLLFRRRELLDLAVPSANSAAMLNLLRLARMTGRGNLEDMAVRIGENYHPELAHHPAACAHMLSARLMAQAPPCEIVLAGVPGSESLERLIAVLGDTYLPQAVILLSGPGGSSGDLEGLIPGAVNFRHEGEDAGVFVCGNFACRKPAREPGELSAILKEVSEGR